LLPQQPAQATIEISEGLQVTNNSSQQFKMEAMTDAQRPRVTIHLFSHARSPPLQPQADLKYDLRKVPNPPKHMRDDYDGRSMRLRRDMKLDSVFRSLLNKARADIEQACSESEQQPTEGAGQGLLAEASSERMNDHDQATQVSVTSGNGGTDNASPPADQPRPSTENVQDDDFSPTQTLRISCFCAAGCHRSVAFAEELAAMDWPKAWHIDVTHRDVDKVRQDRGRQDRGPFAKQRQRGKRAD
jgi:hypothetical protein